MFIQKSGKCVVFMFLFFCSTFLIFSESDFGLIKKTLLLFSDPPDCICINGTKTILENVKTITECEDNFATFKFKKKGNFWVAYNYVISTERFKCQESVTYVTQSDYTFLNNLIPLVERWRGPVSIALHAPGTDFQSTLESIYYLRTCIPIVKKYVTFHLYFSYAHFPKGKLPSHTDAMRGTYNCSLGAPYEDVNRTDMYVTQNKLTYPINVGRNIARSMAETHYVLTSDIELYPSLNIIPRFLEMVAECDTFIRRYRPAVFPLQVFEIKDGLDVPKTKPQLKQLSKKGLAIPFHQDLCKECHAIPKTAEWLNSNESDRLRIFYVAKRTGKYYHWEPFYIGTKADPEFDERLSWEGMSDKIVQAYSMCLLKYSFLILNNVFLVHRPGIKESNPEEKKWRQKYVDQTRKLLDRVIIPQIGSTYGSRYECSL